MIGLLSDYRPYTARWALADLPARRRPPTPAPDPDRQPPASRLHPGPWTRRRGSGRYPASLCSTSGPSSQVRWCGRSCAPPPSRGAGCTTLSPTSRRRCPSSCSRPSRRLRARRPGAGVRPTGSGRPDGAAGPAEVPHRRGSSRSHRRAAAPPRGRLHRGGRPGPRHDGPLRAPRRCRRRASGARGRPAGAPPAGARTAPRPGGRPLSGPDAAHPMPWCAPTMPGSTPLSGVHRPEWTTPFESG